VSALRVHDARPHTTAMLSQRLGIPDQPARHAPEVIPHRLVSANTNISLAIVNDYALVIAGLGALLANEHIDVVRAPLPGFIDVDIVLFDPHGPGRGWPIHLDGGGGPGCGTKMVAYSWQHSPDLVASALAEGAAGCLSKALTGPQMAAALRRIAGGEILVLPEGNGAGATGCRPEALERLSPREAEVMTLIAQGLSNIQIAERLYVSINSVKAHIRSAYRKIGVERRTQAVLWGLEHGLRPPPNRAGHSGPRLG
jgi:two-component system, NarL family, response regulator LiaR